MLESELVKENERLRGEIQSMKWQLIEREIENGRRQFFIPQDLRGGTASTSATNAVEQKAATQTSAPAKDAAKGAAKASDAAQAATPKADNKPVNESAKKQKPAEKAAKESGGKQEEAAKQPVKGEKSAKAAEGDKAKAAGGEKKGSGAERQPKAAAPEQPADIRRINLRIGRVVEVSRHPEADSLYIEKVDVGDPDGRIRTIVSGLVKHVREEDLHGRLAMFMTNLKPAKLRGILSEGMIMCAANEDKSHLEILTVPAGCQPGDRVFAKGFEDGEPDEELNPKRKVWEDFVKPVLRTNADGVACFRDAPLHVPKREGFVHSTVKNAQIS